MEIKKNMTSRQVCEDIAAAFKADSRYQSGMEIAVYGPFGIRAYCSVYLHDEDEEIIACITVEADGSGWYKYETHERTAASYPAGSIGAMNNMDVICKPLPHDMTEVVDLAFAIAKYNVLFTCDLELDDGTKYSFKRGGYADFEDAKKCFLTALTDFLKKRGCAAGTEFTAHVSYEDKDGNYLDSDDGDGIIGATEVLFNVHVTATGLYLSAKDPSEELEKMVFDVGDNSLDADSFLHGVCGVFALALHERYGYAIRYLNGLDEDVEEDEAPMEYLLHVYCVTDDGLFVDVRGMTDDEDKLIEPFLDLCDEHNISGYDYEVDACRADVKSEMSDAEYRAFYNAALSIIDEHPDWYSITTSA